MRKLLTMLLIVAIIGMVPAMANPTSISDSMGGRNLKILNVNTSGSNSAGNAIGQGLANHGNLDNSILNMAIGGNAEADSANVGLANSGADSCVCNSNDSQGQGHALADDNMASVTQSSTATANAGSPEANNEGDQNNNVNQNADATVSNDQSLDQETNIEEYQQANAMDLASVIVIGPFAENDSDAQGQPVLIRR